MTPTKFRGSTFPGNMHTYIWCPYYLPSFMKFRSVVSEVVLTSCFRRIFQEILSSKGATPLKLLNRISWNLVGSKNTICSCAYYQEILISWILWESLLPTKFHEILFSSFRGVALTKSSIIIYQYMYTILLTFNYNSKSILPWLLWLVVTLELSILKISNNPYSDSLMCCDGATGMI
jgi:hypothetical protein